MMDEGKDEHLFIEFMFEGIEFFKWKDFVDKWKLTIITNERCTAYNENFTICITGDSECLTLKKEEISDIELPKIDMPADIVSLIISDKMDTKTMFTFLNDLSRSTYEVDDIDFFIHINKIKDTIHPEWIINKMTQSTAAP